MATKCSSDLDRKRQRFELFSDQRNNSPFRSPVAFAARTCAAMVVPLTWKAGILENGTWKMVGSGRARNRLDPGSELFKLRSRTRSTYANFASRKRFTTLPRDSRKDTGHIGYP